MRQRHTLPMLWLVSDQRNDAAIEDALARLPRGSGLIFRHYHLPPAARAARFRALARLCRRCGLVAVWSGSARTARALGADGCYGAPARLAAGPALLRLAAVHGPGELGAARRARATAALLSPVFPTRSHPGARLLGAARFLLLAGQAPLPVLALGGMTPQTARRVPGHGWAAIDGLTAGRPGLASGSPPQAPRSMLRRTIPGRAKG